MIKKKLTTKNRSRRLTKKGRIEILKYCMPVLSRNCWALAKRYNLPFPEIQNEVAAHIWTITLRYKSKPEVELKKLCYISGKNFLLGLNKYYLRRHRTLQSIGDLVWTNLATQHLGTTIDHLEMLDEIQDKAIILVGRARATTLIFAATFDWKTTKGVWYKHLIMHELGVKREREVVALVQSLQKMLRGALIDDQRAITIKLNSGIWTPIDFHSI